jgi:hypothetical protein
MGINKSAFPVNFIHGVLNSKKALKYKDGNIYQQLIYTTVEQNSKYAFMIFAKLGFLSQKLGFGDLFQYFIGQYQLLINVFQQLAQNAEDRNQFDEASRFRKLAFRTQHRAAFGILNPLYNLYKITSNYGESWSWALVVLLSLILVIFPIIFTQIDFQVSSKNIPLAVVEKKECIDVVIEELRNDCITEKRGLNFWNGEAMSHSFVLVQMKAEFPEIE